MAKNYSNKNRKRKALIAMLCALSVTCTGLAAACANNDEDDKPSTAVTAKEDTQLLKNGDFEHFDIPDKAIHLIKNVNSWSLGGGTSVKSGIIGTSKSEWGKLTDDGLTDKLNYNNDLSSDNDEYVNYNNMRSRDIPYKDTYSAMLDKVDDSWVTKHDGGYEGYFGIEGDKDSGYTLNDTPVYYNADDKEFYFDETFTELVRKEYITNPGTHYDLNEEETKVTVDGKEYDVLKDEATGNLYYKDGDTENYFGNVLMIHNANTSSDHNGMQQYYTSNTISLEAHTSAEISLWVKTSDLRFDKGYAATAEEEDKGAYIEVLQTVASKTVDSFKIKAINTQNILAQAEKDGVTLSDDTVSNGWVKYTVYVNACDFANTSIQLRLGLGGETQNEWVTGYAFFDDVQVTKYRDLGAEGCTYDANKVTNTTCTLTSKEEDKIFYADVATKRDADKQKQNHPYAFNYLIDLASIMDNDAKNNYSPINFGSNVEVGLTTEKDSKGNEYAAAKSIDSSNTKITVTQKEQTDDYKLPKDVKARPTNEDIIKVLGANEDFGKYSKLLDNVIGENAAPELLEENNGNTLLMFSAWGAPYTATLTDNTKFTVANDKYMLVSFWVKTSDMNGNTAATAKIYELDKDGLVDENSVKTITIDTTDKTTDFEDDKDIYNGWVQCFFFVKNDVEDGKKFQIDFSFGTTAITTATSFESGYAAFANLQVLEINEDIYDLASDGDTTKLFSFSKDTEKDGGKPFDEAKGTDDINNGIALPSKYEVANGANIPGSLYSNKYAGLINKEVFDDENSAMTADEKTAILKGFLPTAEKWSDVFGDNCYQPLIIINNLREYAISKDADKDTYKNYWIKNADDTYTKVAADAEYDENETYYSLVSNYGFVGEDKSVSANGREVISVRVKVTGNAVAYIYLIDTDDTDKILNYSTPSYNFWYDGEGNVLDEEFDEDWTTAKHREHIVYTLREDGLYEDKDGKLYGNLYNLVKSYKDSKYERVQYYYEDGTPVEGGYDYVEKHGDGKTFYKADGTIADHYLCTTDGTHVYEYKDGKYYYVEITKKDGKTTETTDFSNEINNFDTGKAHLKYTPSDESKELFVKVTEDDCNGGWITVNFAIKAGSEAKHYRLELWSGERDKTGVNDDGSYTTGAVAFDYVHGTVSENRLAAYEKEVINAFNAAFNEYAPKVLENEKTLGTDANIADYEKVLESLKTTDADKAAQIVSAMASYKYVASYYTYTLYDSAAYVPFNATTAGDGETGYDYDASSFSEQLAYFEFEDTAHGQKNVFVDYSAVDQSISKNTVDDEDKTDDEETANNSAELGLYISSIVLVVVLLITLVSILITQYVRKRRKASGKKNNDKNAYRKRDRYVKKLHLVKDEMVEPENGETETGDVPAEEVTPVENEVTEVPAEETAEPTETTETVEPAEGEDKE